MPDLPPLIGQSPAFLEVMEAASRVAPLNRPVLVIGERGTGKQLVALRLHFLSRRWNGPLVELNCAALTESLVESELFGHEAGAFTGAVRRRTGRFEQADGGTLFLDEIANAPLSIQEKVLRVVEYGAFERVGSSATVQCDVRLVAATNVDLPVEARAGRFREDLLDRLSFDVLTLPPLRARPEDIPVLADHFARAMAVELGWEDAPEFSDGAMESLSAYAWPGNVRELRNVVERAVYRWADPQRPIDTITMDPFESPYRIASAPKSEPPVADKTASKSKSTISETPLPEDLDAAVAAYEADLLSRALAETRFNQRAAAQRVGLGYHPFRTRLKRHGLLPRAVDAAERT